MISFDEPMPTHEFIERHLDVVHLAVVQVDEQRPVVLEAPQGSLDPGHEELLEIVEVVVVRAALDLFYIVAPPAEPPTVALPVGCRYEDAVALLDLPGVEGRVDVDEPRELLREGREHIRVVAEDDLLHGAPAHHSRWKARCRRVRRRSSARNSLSVHEFFFLILAQNPNVRGGHRSFSSGFVPRRCLGVGRGSSRKASFHNLILCPNIFTV